MPASSLPDALKEAESLQSVEITKLDMQWLQVLAEGWANPLTGMQNLANHASSIC